MSAAGSAHEPGEEYAGGATVLGPDGQLETELRLRGHFQPIDGRFHWWGRLPASPVADAWGNGTTVRVRTPYGEARGRLTDVDPWGRFRVSGTGRPPF